MLEKKHDIETMSSYQNGMNDFAKELYDLVNWLLL